MGPPCASDRVHVNNGHVVSLPSAYSCCLISISLRKAGLRGYLVAPVVVAYLRVEAMHVCRPCCQRAFAECSTEVHGFSHVAQLDVTRWHCQVVSIASGNRLWIDHVGRDQGLSLALKNPCESGHDLTCGQLPLYRYPKSSPHLGEVPLRPPDCGLALVAGSSETPCSTFPPLGSCRSWLLLLLVSLLLLIMGTLMLVGVACNSHSLILILWRHY